MFSFHCSFNEQMLWPRDWNWKRSLLVVVVEECGREDHRVQTLFVLARHRFDDGQTDTRSNFERNCAVHFCLFVDERSTMADEEFDVRISLFAYANAPDRIRRRDDGTCGTRTKYWLNVRSLSGPSFVRSLSSDGTPDNNVARSWGSFSTCRI